MESPLSPPLPLFVQIARRSWSGHPLANDTLAAAMAAQPKLIVTLPHQPPTDDLLDNCL